MGKIAPARPASSKLTLSGTGEVGDFRGEGVARLDAIGQGNAVAHISADEKAGMVNFATGHRLKKTFVTDIVLRNGFGPERVMRENGLSRYAEKLAQIGQDAVEQKGRRQPRGFGLSRAPHENSQGRMTIGCAPGK